MKILITEPLTTLDVCIAARGGLQALVLLYYPEFNGTTHAECSAPKALEYLFEIDEPKIPIQIALILKGLGNCGTLSPAPDLAKALASLNPEQMTQEEVVYITQMMEAAITQAVIHKR